MANSVKLVPKRDDDMKPTMAELKALSRELPYFGKVFAEVFELGPPIFVSEVDQAATNATGNCVFAFKRSKELNVFIATMRALGKLKPDEIGIDHAATS